MQTQLNALKDPTISSHPNVVKLQGYCNSVCDLGLVYDCHALGTLHSLIFDGIKIPHVFRFLWHCTPILKRRQRISLSVYFYCKFFFLCYFTESFSWSMRMKVALQLARVLQFLHSQEKPLILLNFEPRSILVDMVCKI